MNSRLFFFMLPLFMLALGAAPPAGRGSVSVNASKAVPRTRAVATKPGTAIDANPFAARFPYLVHVVVTPTNWYSGDNIEVTSVRGDRPVLEGGGTYLVQGRYVLGSAFMATLMLCNLYPRGPLHDPYVQSMWLERGRGRFALMVTEMEGGPFFLEFYLYDGSIPPRGRWMRRGTQGNPRVDRVYIENR